MKPYHMLFVCSVCVFRRVLTAGRTSSTQKKMVRTTSCPTESVIATAMTWSMPNPSSLATEVHKHTNKPTQTHLHTLSNGLFFHCFRTPHQKKITCFFDSSKIDNVLKCNFPNFNSYLNQYLALDYRSCPTVWILSRFPFFHVCVCPIESVWKQQLCDCRRETALSYLFVQTLNVSSVGVRVLQTTRGSLVRIMGHVRPAFPTSWQRSV